MVNELTAEKLEVCAHHILPLTLHAILAPLSSALVELEEKWKQTGIILTETYQIIYLSSYFIKRHPGAFSLVLPLKHKKLHERRVLAAQRNFTPMERTPS